MPPLVSVHIEKKHLSSPPQPSTWLKGPAHPSFSFLTSEHQCLFFHCAQHIRASRNHGTCVCNTQLLSSCSMSQVANLPGASVTPVPGQVAADSTHKGLPEWLSWFSRICLVRFFFKITVSAFFIVALPTWLKVALSWEVEMHHSGIKCKHLFVCFLQWECLKCPLLAPSCNLRHMIACKCKWLLTSEKIRRRYSHCPFDMMRSANICSIRKRGQ